MTSRNYSSFLLRLWIVNGSDTEIDPDNLPVLQLQHLQTGLTWRLRSLKELDEILASAIVDGPDWISSSANSPKQTLAGAVSNELDKDIE